MIGHTKSHSHTAPESTSYAEAHESSPLSTWHRGSTVIQNLFELAARGAVWFSYERNLDTAHVWFTLDQRNATSVSVDDRLALLVDDDTEELIGFTLEGFQQVVMKELPLVEQILHRVGWPHWLRYDVPPLIVSGLDADSDFAGLTRIATASAFARLLRTDSIEF
jgi:hypothetical protein